MDINFHPKQSSIEIAPITLTHQKMLANILQISNLGCKVPFGEFSHWLVGSQGKAATSVARRKAEEEEISVKLSLLQWNRERIQNTDEKRCFNRQTGGSSAGIRSSESWIYARGFDIRSYPCSPSSWNWGNRPCSVDTYHVCWAIGILQDTTIGPSKLRHADSIRFLPWFQEDRACWVGSQRLHGYVVPGAHQRTVLIVGPSSWGSAQSGESSFLDVFGDVVPCFSHENRLQT